MYFLNRKVFQTNGSNCIPRDGWWQTSCASV